MTSVCDVIRITEVSMARFSRKVRITNQLTVGEEREQDIIKTSSSQSSW